MAFCAYFPPQMYAIISALTNPGWWMVSRLSKLKRPILPDGSLVVNIEKINHSYLCCCMWSQMKRRASVRMGFLKNHPAHIVSAVASQPHVLRRVFSHRVSCRSTCTGTSTGTGISTAFST